MPAQKRRKLSAFFSESNDAKTRDRDLEEALALSAKEAELASMDDDEQLKAALQASIEETERQHSEGKPSTAIKTSAASVPAPFKLPDKKRPSPHDDDRDALAQVSSTHAGADPTLDEAAYDTSKETTINRLEGSLDLLYSKGWIRPRARLELREWMLTQLAWHRVSYIRPRTTMRIVTPRYTTTFGKDDTGAPDSVYKAKPKPFPPILRKLCDDVEQKTGAKFNAMIINYYANGQDSISYHSDDEAFLGKLPTIASISLGAARDFYLRRKAPATQAVPDARAEEKMGTKGKGPAATRPMEKFRLEDGDLLVMRGRTQADWEHSIPKRTSHVGGRINITFRRVMNVSGTNNFLRYNRLGDSKDGDVFRWNALKRQMEPGQGGL